MDCLLCLETKRENESNSIIVGSSQWEELNTKNLIDKHLWPIDCPLPASCVCGTCWKELYDFHKFYIRIEQTHYDNRIVIKFETDPLPDETKPKDVLMKGLQEPEIVIGQNLDEPIKIKQEYDEPIADMLESNDDSEDVEIKNDISENSCSIFKNEQDPMEFTDNNSDSNLSDYNDEEDDRTDSDDDLPLIQKIKNQQSKKRSRKSNKTKNINNDDYEDNEDNDKKRKKIASSSSPQSTLRANLSTNKKTSTLPKMNCAEYDKFLEEHFKITCDKCQKTFERFRLLCQHFSQEHNEQGYVMCCDTKFFNRHLLVDHINYHLDPEYFKCNLCGKVLTKRIFLISHMKMHKEKKFACDECDRKFVLKYMLDKHKLTHLPESEKKFPCNDCGKFYANEYMLNQHQKAVHLNVYAKVCEICGETLPDSQYFKRHMEKHDGIVQVKTATCDICGLILTNHQTLKLHKEEKHPPEKREYNCHICSKVSPNLRALKKHIHETHEMGYRFKCTICEKEFKRSDNFKSHMAMHTGKPLHRCPWCPKEFNSNGNMHQHRKKAHPVEWEEAQRKKYSGNLPPNYRRPTTTSVDSQ
ncbi:transcription factor grauzone isoform X1 [Musca domestica]|uniref:Transcription factor grauzone isoform X1 n=1 Tax=Musca domestica TaxID=7370 RepID=A0A9J7D273_MUSDO|nr:transcription factor grauzone isoform X1 [Musca domestica]XP_011294914.2 transcription factor grauzone isoform X1 [Musca domestica]XP_011294915.2 transcription factor grauzone isoform X1 [Musca domestica]XP_058986081.1 transcription factor grauzone isoform X1 [Musca domestica]